MILLDFSKAFDSLNHGKLLLKLGSNFGFSSSAVSLIRNYLSERFQCVCIDGHVSEFPGINAGIPQGSVLGPLLFSMYINDLPRCLRSTSHHMFADDVQLFFSSPKGAVNEAIFRVNQDLYAVNRWARENFLKLNAKKSQAIVFDANDKLLSPRLLPYILLGGVVIPYAGKVLNLGLVKTRKMLVKSLVLPAFTYGDSIYSTNLSASAVRSLEGAFNACVRFVYRLRRYDSNRDYVNELLGCPIMTYLKRRRCSFVHSLVMTREPGFLYDKLLFGRSVRNRPLLIPRHSSAQYGRSVFVRAVADYNMIPACVRRHNSLSEFSYYCQGHLR